MKCRVVVFHQGRRIERNSLTLDEGKELVRKLHSKGVKSALVTCDVLLAYRYPPPGDDLSNRNMGMMWCPYCREWRWFKIPKFTGGAPVGSEPWFMNSFHRQEIAVCAWCRIGENDFHVMRANGTWGNMGRRRRRKKRRVR